MTHTAQHGQRRRDPSTEPRRGEPAEARASHTQAEAGVPRYMQPPTDLAEEELSPESADPQAAAGRRDGSSDRGSGGDDADQETGAESGAEGTEAEAEADAEPDAEADADTEGERDAEGGAGEGDGESGAGDEGSEGGEGGGRPAGGGERSGERGARETAGEDAGIAGGDLALIDEELAEHERWAGSFGEMGTTGSDQRAQFLLDQAGRGAAAGAWGGATMGLVMGAVGGAVGQIAGRRLATLAVSRGLSATPVPGLGAAIGGVMAVAGLAMRDWGATGETIGRIGEGEGYERLANDLEGIAEVLDVAASIMDVLAGVLGGIAVGMWVGAVLSAGALSPLAATLSAIALGINLATTAVGVIISVVVRPTVTALRALHAFESQGDPSQIEADGQQLQGAAGQVTGAAAGALAGRVGGAAGRRGGTRADQAATRWQSRQTGGRPAMSAAAGPGPRVHVEVPEAPSRVAAAGGAPVATTAPSTTPTTARPAATGGPRAASPGHGPSGPARPPEDFSDLGDVVADLNASPAVAARLTDTRAPLAPRATPWGPGEARAYASRQAASHRSATGMTGAEVQAGHTAAARHGSESGIREADWDTQPMMDLHSRRGRGLDATVTGTTTDPTTGQTTVQTSTRTRHTAQEGMIDAAVARSREAQGQLTPQGQLDAAAQVAWATENTPFRQGDIDRVRASGPAAPGRGPAVDPATGRVMPPPSAPSGPAASSPRARAADAPDASTAPRPVHASHTETARTTDRSDAMAQYHAQVRADPGRESGVWRGPDGTFYVMQGDAGSVAPPSAPGPLQLVYHSHPTETGVANQGLVSQPSQAAGDFGVLQYQHGEGAAGTRQDSELHFPTYDASGAQSGYGATRFAYDPTHPLPLQVQTTLPGGGASTQRYASFDDYQQRTGIAAGGDTTADSTSARVAADARLRSDQAAAQERIDTTAQTLGGGRRTQGAREAREAARQEAAEPAEESGAQGPARGPAYTAAIDGLQPGETMELPINPAYPPPPGTTAELDALLEQAGVAQRAQRQLSGTESAMQTQASEQQAHDAELGEAQTVTDDLATGRSEHQGAIDATQETNTEQQSTAGEAIDALGQSAQEGAALVTLVGSLEMFRGMADLFSYLPGDLGASAEGASADAGELIDALNRVSETESVQANVEGGRTGMEADGQRIEGVATEGQATDEELAQGQADVTELTQLNAERLAETEATQEQAMGERQAAASSEEEAQAAHDDLLGQMQSWAQSHRQAREDAINDAVARYSELGYQVQALP